MSRVDHVVVAGGNLDRLVAWFAATTGVTPTPGGAHVGMGTRNALVGLGAGAYLELIAPDPDQPEPAAPRPFGVDQLGPDDRRLTSWAVSVDGLDAALAALPPGTPVGESMAMSRLRPDGVRLAWDLSLPSWPVDGGVVPFLIDWGTSPHPAADLGSACTVERMAVRHPDPDRITAILAALALDGAMPIEVGAGVVPGLELRLRCPGGPVDLVATG